MDNKRCKRCNELITGSGIKYCSRSCAASVNNVLYPKRDSVSSVCMECGGRLKVNAKKYCGYKCMSKHHRESRIADWLETGTFKAKARVPECIRNYLLDSQGGCCAICSLNGLWNGKEIVFISDHIDGNSTNNHRDNLRMICPNCDSQLPTFKARNKGNGRKWRRDRYIKDNI